jgi:hypothetical protein
LHRFHKERRRSPRGCFECGDTTHFIVDCPKRKKLDSSSNKYDYTKQNDYSKDDDKKKYEGTYKVVKSVFWPKVGLGGGGGALVRPACALIFLDMLAKRNLEKRQHLAHRPRRWIRPAPLWLGWARSLCHIIPSCHILCDYALSWTY